MPVRDIVVLGGSAGSVEAIQTVVSSFPSQMRAALFIVVHLPSRGPSYLPGMLGRISGRLVREAAEGDPIEPGRIYIAAPDRHLLISRNTFISHGGPGRGCTARASMQPFVRRRRYTVRA